MYPDAMCIYANLSLLGRDVVRPREGGHWRQQQLLRWRGERQRERPRKEPLPQPQLLAEAEPRLAHLLAGAEGPGQELLQVQIEVQVVEEDDGRAGQTERTIAAIEARTKKLIDDEPTKTPNATYYPPAAQSMWHFLIPHPTTTRYSNIGHVLTKVIK